MNTTRNISPIKTALICAVAAITLPSFGYAQFTTAWGGLIPSAKISESKSGGKSWNRDVDFAGSTVAEVGLDLNYAIDYERSISSTFFLGESGLDAGIDGAATLKVFGIGGEAASFDANVNAEKASGTATGTGSYSVKLKVAGTTVYSNSGSSSAKLTKSYDKTFSQTWLDKSKTFMVGPVPVVVQASLESSVTLDTDMDIDPVGMSAGIAGNAAVVPGEVRLSAGVGFDLGGVIGASAGISGELEFAKANLSANFTVDPWAGIDGKLTYALHAMTLKMSLYVEGYIKLILKVKKRWELVLFSKSYGSKSGTLFSL